MYTASLPPALSQPPPYGWDSGRVEGSRFDAMFEYEGAAQEPSLNAAYAPEKESQHAGPVLNPHVDCSQTTAQQMFGECPPAFAANTQEPVNYSLPFQKERYNASTMFPSLNGNAGSYLNVPYNVPLQMDENAFANAYASLPQNVRGRFSQASAPFSPLSWEGYSSSALPVQQNFPLPTGVMNLDAPPSPPLPTRPFHALNGTSKKSRFGKRNACSCSLLKDLLTSWFKNN